MKKFNSKTLQFRCTNWMLTSVHIYYVNITHCSYWNPFINWLSINGIQYICKTIYEIIYCLQIVYLGPSSWIWQGSVFQPQMFQSCEKFSKSFVFKALRLFFKWLILDFKIPICKTVPIILFDWKNIGHSTKLEKNGKRKTWQTRIPVGNIPISAK